MNYAAAPTSVLFLKNNMASFVNLTKTISVGKGNQTFNQILRKFSTGYK